jgi:hypothetical protein
MDDREIERGLDELKASWRIPGDPPLDQMWRVIEGRAFPGAPMPSRSLRWSRTLLPLAAMLVLGFGIGQIAPPLLESPRRWWFNRQRLRG